MSRPSWDEWALAGARWAATRADCTRRQVGCVILDEDRRIVASGYNGYPAGRGGCSSTGVCPRGRMSFEQVASDSPYVETAAPCNAIHAEENAILYARTSLVGCTLYVTDAPCPNCRRLLAGTGLARVVWPTGEEDLRRAPE